MPRGYFPRAGANRWTDEQKERLERLALAKQPWTEIAEACGHPKSSCQSTLAYIRRQRRRAKSLEEMTKPRPPVIAPNFMQAPTQIEPTGRHRRMSTLVQDAELRARIEVLGATGGLLGDPLPGRSALDQKSQHGAIRPTLALSASASRVLPAHDDADASFMDGAT